MCGSNIKNKFTALNSTHNVHNKQLGSFSNLNLLDRARGKKSAEGGLFVSNGTGAKERGWREAELCRNYPIAAKCFARDWHE